jgi:hypothetical protein
VTYAQAHRVDQLIRAGCDDATIAREGFSLEDIGFQRLFTEKQMEMERLTRTEPTDSPQRGIA